MTVQKYYTILYKNIVYCKPAYSYTKEHYINYLIDVNKNILIYCQYALNNVTRVTKD